MENDTKQCPFCGERIKFEAKKCKHCGEWLEKKYNIFTNNKNFNTKLILKYGPCKTVMSLINFVILAYTFFRNDFVDFSWDEFGGFLVWVAISSTIAMFMDEYILKK